MNSSNINCKNVFNWKNSSSTSNVIPIQKKRLERDFQEKGFRLTREREKQKLFFQQQLEQAHLQAELTETEAELSSNSSTIGVVNNDCAKI